MYHVTANKSANTLSITFRQFVGQRATLHCREEVEKALAKLQPGFHLLTDLSGLDSMDYSCAAEIGIIMDLCRKSGVAKVVRIIPDVRKDIGFNLLTLFHYGHAVPVVTVATLEEALKALSS